MPTHYMTLDEIAGNLQVSYRYVWKGWRHKFPNAITLGPEIRIPKSDYDAWLASLRAQTAELRQPEPAAV